MSAVRRFAVVVVVLTLCGAAWAGNVQVTVSEALAPVSAANVTIEPDGMTGTTNAAGKWNATGVTAGDAMVIAWTDAGGTLRGAIAEVTVPAHGSVSVDLSLVRAIWIQNYYPMAVGNKWEYEYRHSEVGGRPYRTTWREEVLRTVMMGPDRAVVLEAQKAGVPEWEEIRASSADGFKMYTQQHGADEIKFDPPIRLGALMPLGYEWVASATAHHSDGSPDTPVTFRAKLVRFEDSRVPAGMFRDCAYLEVTSEFGPEVNDMALWMAKNVGVVREIEKNPERTNEKLLTEYKIVGVPIRPLMPLRPMIRPKGH